MYGMCKKQTTKIKINYNTPPTTPHSIIASVALATAKRCHLHAIYTKYTLHMYRMCKK